MSDGQRPTMHGRDHRPGGADPIKGLIRAEYAHLIMKLGQTVSSSSGLSAMVAWEAFWTTDSVVFGTNDDGGATLTNAYQDTYLMLRGPGIYIASAHIQFDGGAYTQRMSLDTSAFGLLEVSGGPTVGGAAWGLPIVTNLLASTTLDSAGNTGTAQDSDGPLGLSETVMLWFDATRNDMYLRVRVGQGPTGSGVDETLSHAVLQVTYIELPTTPPSLVFSPP